MDIGTDHIMIQILTFLHYYNISVHDIAYQIYALKILHSYIGKAFFFLLNVLLQFFYYFMLKWKFRRNFVQKYCIVYLKLYLKAMNNFSGADVSTE